jgi:enterochelin esterase-like enzyme/sugar lactone lactonase YvrE
MLLGLIVLTGAAGAEEYVLGADSQPQPGVPQGEVTKHSWTSRIFPGTVRDYWVYVPRQYDPSRPAPVMVFQDGANYINKDGSWRVPVVFDNLIHKHEMPVTVGIFINPGVVPASSESALPRFNRSFEYDAVSDRYARFLLEEILPEVGKSWNLATDGNSRAIAGASSGAICAFTAAWERPDAFRRVLSTIGTYVGLRGGHGYPTLVRKTEPKPLRVFLQDGSNDLNIYGGNWWLANQEMLSAFEFAGYDVKSVWGDGGHDGKQGGAILPDALRWLWRDYPAAVGAAGPSKQPLMTNLLLPEEGWRDVGRGYGLADSLAVNGQGEVFFADVAANRIHRITADGTIGVYREGTRGARGLAFGAGGRLYAAQPGRRRIVAYEGASHETVVADGVDAYDLALSHQNRLYATDPAGRRLWLVEGSGRKTAVETAIGEPSGIVLSPDQSLVLVADRRGQLVWSFQVQADGTLAHGQPYFHLHLVEGETASGADGLAVDANGNVYVSTRLGVQVCDQAGRVNGIVSRPQPGALGRVAFGGAGRDELFVGAGDGVYRRKSRVRGVLSFEAPVKPNPPRL